MKNNIFQYFAISLCLTIYSNVIANDILGNTTINDSEKIFSMIDVEGLKDNQISLNLKNKSCKLSISNKKKFPIAVEINVYSENGNEISTDVLNLFPQSFIITENSKQDVNIDISKFSELNGSNKFNIEFRVSGVLLNNANETKEYSKKFDLIVDYD